MRFSGSVYNFRIQGKIKLVICFLLGDSPASEIYMLVPNCNTGLLGLLIES